MKKLISTFLMFAVIVCMITATAITASAAEIATQDGIEVSIATDKDSYTSTDDINVTVSVKNTNTYDVNDVNVTVELSEGLSLKSGTLSVNDVDIKAGETYTKNVIAVKAASSSEEQKQEDNPTKTEEDNKQTSPQTGDDSHLILWIILLVFLVAGIMLSFKYRKKATKMLSLFLCVAMLAAVVPLGAIAAEQNNSSISVKKAIKVNKTKMIIKAVVKYDANTNETLTEVEKYYRDNSEKIVSVDAVNTNNVLSEQEVYLLLQERGFAQYPVTYEYDLDGNYIGEKSVSKDSNTKHPMYLTLYVTSCGNVWSVFVIGKTIVANPAFHNAQVEEELQVLIAEGNTLTSYDDTSNLFYITIPKNSIIELMELEKIDSETIEKITFKEVE